MPPQIEVLAHNHLRQGLPEKIAVKCSLRSLWPALLPLALLPLPLLALSLGSSRLPSLSGQVFFFAGTLTLAMLAVALLMHLHIYLQNRIFVRRLSLRFAPGLNENSPVNEGFMALLPAYEIALDDDLGAISLITGEYLRRLDGWRLIDRFDWPEGIEDLPLTAPIIDICTSWDAFIQQIAAENTVRLAAEVGLHDLEGMLAKAHEVV